MWSKVISVLFVVACVGCTGTWEKRASTTMMVASNATIVCDLSQTLWFAHGGAYDRSLHEINPVLGRSPSPERIIATNIAALAGNTAMYFILPAKWRPYWFGGVLLIEGANVATQPDPRNTMKYGEHKSCDFMQNYRDWTRDEGVASTNSVLNVKQ